MIVIGNVGVGVIWFRGKKISGKDWKCFCLIWINIRVKFVSSNSKIFGFF